MKLSSFIYSVVIAGAILGTTKYAVSNMPSERAGRSPPPMVRPENVNPTHSTAENKPQGNSGATSPFDNMTPSQNQGTSPLVENQQQAALGSLPRNEGSSPWVTNEQSSGVQYKFNPDVSTSGYLGGPGAQYSPSFYDMNRGSEASTGDGFSNGFEESNTQTGPSPYLAP